MPKKNVEPSKNFVERNLSTVFVDNLSIAGRSDGLNYLRFSTALPEGLKEEAHFMIPTEALQRMIDILCEQSDYFPSKPKQSSKKSKQSK